MGRTGSNAVVGTRGEERQEVSQSAGSECERDCGDWYFLSNAWPRLCRQGRASASPVYHMVRQPRGKYWPGCFPKARREILPGALAQLTGKFYRLETEMGQG